jgi:DNA-directed RNA polymerase subunit RPC12/RpoP
MPTEFCPECEKPIRIGPRPKIGQGVTCPHCTTRLQVTEVSPLEFYWAEDEQPLVPKGAKSSVRPGAGRW